MSRGQGVSEQRDELPEGWVWAPLGDVCTINPRHERAFLADDQPVSFVPMAAVDHRSGAIVGSSVKPYGQVRKGFTHFAEGDVLFARITPCMENGKVAVARNLINGLGCGTTEFHILRPLGGILPEYIHRYVRQESFRRAAAANMSGTAGQLRVPTGYIKRVEVPLAPLAEHRRIVAKIEALFEQSRTARQALDRIPPLLKKFRQSTLAAAFRGDLTRDWREQHPDVEPASVLLDRIRTEHRRKWEEDLRAKGEDYGKARYDEPKPLGVEDRPKLPDGWVWVEFARLVSFVTSGSRGWAKYYSDDGPIFLRVGNLDHDSVSLDLAQVVRVSPPDGTEGTRTKVAPGDILISITADVGMVGIVPEDIGEAYINQHIALARPLSGPLSLFLAYYLASYEGGQKQFTDMQYGMTKTGLNLANVKDVHIPLAPLSEQHHIVTRIKEMFSHAHAIEAAVEAARRQADKLDQSILTRAFCGGLVPQDPNDEPASVLLDRICRGRARNGVMGGRKHF